MGIANLLRVLLPTSQNRNPIVLHPVVFRNLPSLAFDGQFLALNTQVIVISIIITMKEL